MTIKPGMVVDLLIRMGVPLTDIPADRVLIREGTKGNNVYVLHEGEVSVTQQFSEIAIIRDEGAMLGEIAALLGIERTATVTTTKNSTFFVIEDLHQFMEENPKATVAVLKNMAQQIIDRDKDHPGIYIGLKRLRGRESKG